MADSRTKNTSRNILAGLIYQAISILMPFVNRTVILRLLGAEFTGVGSLFTSVLGVLNIAELGFDTAIVYSMYKPMSENDNERICYLLTLFRKIYRIVGCVIFAGGICVMPFLPHLIKGECPEQLNLYFTYLLYLINASAGYFLFAYKQSVLFASQRKDIVDNIRSAVNIGRYALQFALLLVTRSYYLYVTASILGTVAANIITNLVTVKKYPKLRAASGIKVRFDAEVKKHVGGLFINRICDTCRNSFDNIIISSFFGLVVTAMYDNYYYVYSSLYAVMLIICNAMGASIGNSILKENQDKNYNDMMKFSFIFAWVAGWCTVCMLCLYQPFVELWAGKDLVFPVETMVLFCVYFYAINMNNIRNQYANSTGLWWHLRASYIVEAAANLALNILLGKLLGVNGIVLATIITIFLSNFIWRTVILFRHYFKGKSLMRFFGLHAYCAAVTCIAGGVTFFLTTLFDYSPLVTLFVNGGLCVIVPNILFFMFYFKTRQFTASKAFAVALIKKFFTRKK